LVRRKPKRTFLSSLVWLLPVATTAPSRTTTQPTGTSHRSSAASASTSAARMKRSSSALNSPGRRGGAAIESEQNPREGAYCTPNFHFCQKRIPQERKGESRERTRRAAGGESGGFTLEVMAAAEEESASPPPLHEVLTPERAIDLVGMGAFQRWLTLLCMLGNAADAVEVLSIALVLPTAGREFGLSDADKGLLTSCIFAGGFMGSLGWGLVGDRFGRRAALAVAMFINALFALLSGRVGTVHQVTLLSNHQLMTAGPCTNLTPGSDDRSMQQI
jgi:hypothetical protein